MLTAGSSSLVSQQRGRETNRKSDGAVCHRPPSALNSLEHGLRLAASKPHFEVRAEVFPVDLQHGHVASTVHLRTHAHTHTDTDTHAHTHTFAEVFLPVRVKGQRNLDSKTPSSINMWHENQCAGTKYGYFHFSNMRRCKWTARSSHYFAAPHGGASQNEGDLSGS